jgi:VIT1/CCC1 family predicted Fe2+/Mn2+ transporter
MLFRLLIGGGTLLLGAALLVAPVLAFTDHMTTVSALGIAGMVLLLAGWLVRRFSRPGSSSDDAPPPER